MFRSIATNTESEKNIHWMIPWKIYKTIPPKLVQTRECITYKMQLKIS